jgi:hypothetical protein
VAEQVTEIFRELARRFHRRAGLLDSPARTVAGGLVLHGFVQIDPIPV